MEVESFSKQQLFDSLVKLANDNKAEAAASLAEHKREAQDLHSITMETMGAIRAELSSIRSRLDIIDPKSAPSA